MAKPQVPDSKDQSKATAAPVTIDAKTQEAKVKAAKRILAAIGACIQCLEDDELPSDIHTTVSDAKARFIKYDNDLKSVATAPELASLMIDFDVLLAKIKDLG